MNAKGRHVQFSLPRESLFDYYNVKQLQPQLPNVKNEIIMGVLAYKFIVEFTDVNVVYLVFPL